MSHPAYPAPALIACMTAHKEEMKALNMQIAELEKTKVAAGGPNTKMGECANRLQTHPGQRASVRQRQEHGRPPGEDFLPHGQEDAA